MLSWGRGSLAESTGVAGLAAGGREPSLVGQQLELLVLPPSVAKSRSWLS